MSSAFIERRIRAQDFSRRPERRRRDELIRGLVVERAPATPRQGQVCGQAYFLLRLFVEARRNGLLLCNDVGILTVLDPDTVRGADIAYYPPGRMPGGRLPSTGFLEIPPELVVDVRTTETRWADEFARAVEFLNCGVSTVVVLDVATASAQLYRQDEPVRILQATDELSLPGDLEGFHARVGRFFD